METKKQLQVGDVLYGHSRWVGLEKYVIERVTDKQAFSKNGRKFKRDIEPGGARRIGEYGYAIIETDDLKEQFYIQSLTNKVAKLYSTFRIPGKCTKEQFDEIISFFSKYQKPTT